MVCLNGVIGKSLLKVLLAEVWAGVGKSNKGWYKILELETVGSMEAQRGKRPVLRPEPIKSYMKRLPDGKNGLCLIDLDKPWWSRREETWEINILIYDALQTSASTSYWPNLAVDATQKAQFPRPQSRMEKGGNGSGGTTENSYPRTFESINHSCLN